MYEILPAKSKVNGETDFIKLENLLPRMYKVGILFKRYRIYIYF